jgi:hypothetical protein
MEYLDPPICHILDIIAQSMKKFFKTTCALAYLFLMSPRRHGLMQLAASQAGAGRGGALSA